MRTRSKHKQDSESKPSSKEATGLEPPAKRKRREKKSKAACPENQAVIDALTDLSSAAFRAQSVDAKNRFKGIALRKAATSLAELENAIGQGDALAKGPRKVAGIGKGIAAYIDEFLETGEIQDIAKYEEMAKQSAAEPDVRVARTASAEATPASLKDKVVINRAPVLTLWVTVVAQRQGFAREEACSYGKWVAGTLAQSKGRSLGIYEAKELSEEERKARKDRGKTQQHHVEAFGHIKIPIIEHNGHRLAVSGGRAIDSVPVEGYLGRAFGNRLDAAEEAMNELAYSMPPEELQKNAYTLYESFRPEWKGWGKKSLLDLGRIRSLAKS